MSDDERRRMGRISTERIAIISRIDGSGAIRECRVLDRSSGGMRLRSSSSESVGVTVNIELKPAADDHGGDTVFLKGIVIHVSETEDGDFDLGIRLNLRGGSGGGGGGGRPRFAMMRDHVIREQLLPPMFVTKPIPAKKTQPIRSAQAKKARQRKTNSWKWLGPALVFLLLFLSIPLAGELLYKRLPGSIRTTSWTTQAVEEDEPRSLAGSSTAHHAPTDSNAFDEVPPAVVAFSKPYNSAPVAAALNREPDVPRLIAMLDEALAAGPGKQGETARSNARDAASRRGIPEAWRNAARRILSNENVAKKRSQSFGHLTDAMKLTPTQRKSQTSDDVYIEVDVSDFVLKVKRGNAVLREFPVGLGRNGSTPIGEYEVVNKLTNPTWYNKGNSVAPGDPANPLGSRWMGLGNDGAGNTYGIHPTNTPNSIGQPASAGCIRMFPHDAESLFRMCPLGARVVIHA